MSFKCRNVTPVFDRLKEELSKDLSDAFLYSPRGFTFSEDLNTVQHLISYAVSHINEVLYEFPVLYTTAIAWQITSLKNLIYSLDMKNFVINIQDFDFKMGRIDLERSRTLKESGQIYLYDNTRDIVDDDVRYMITALMSDISDDEKDSLLLLTILNN